MRDNHQPGPVHLFAVDNSLFNEPKTAGCSVADPTCQLSICQQQEVAITTFSPSLAICDPASSGFLSNNNCQTGRRALPIFGDGLVEAVDDSALEQLAEQEPEAVRGIAKMVVENGVTRVGRFGWKADHATLRGFSGDAYLNEIGITNPDHPKEVSECAVAEGLETLLADEPEDTTDANGRADMDRFADFMRGLNPPPSKFDSEGKKLFAKTGCADCHTMSMMTSSNPSAFIPATTGGVSISDTLNVALTNQTFHPFSDFLLHDMGSLGDGITSGDANPTMMRTAPLWGLSVRTNFLHDGRAREISSAISAHDGQGKAAAEAFAGLSASKQKKLLKFLRAL